MARSKPLEYVALQLNRSRPESWAVVERPSGALALDRQGKLLIRFSESVARDLARALTDELLDREAAPEEAPAPVARRVRR